MFRGISLSILWIAISASPMATAASKTSTNCVQALNPTSAQVHRRLQQLLSAETAQGRIIINPEAATLYHTALGHEGKEILERLNTLMIGHQDLKLALAQAVQRAVTAQNEGRPIGAFLLLGLTGTGKSLTASALAEAVHGDPKKLLEINSGEFQQDHEIAKLFGSPPGYVGHNSTAPMLTQARLNELTSSKYGVNIVLVDEFEKAGTALQRIMLGYLEHGRGTTGSNEPLDMTRTIFIFTSNLGQAEIQRAVDTERVPMGFASISPSAQDVENQIETLAREASGKFFPPEFRNRIDGTFVFGPHTEDEVKQILNMQLAASQRKSFFASLDARILFTLTPEAKDFVLKRGYSAEFGGRSIRRAVSQLVIDPITNLLGSGQSQNGDVIEVSVAADGNSLVFKKIAERLSIQELGEIYDMIYGNQVPPPNLELSAAAKSQLFKRTTMAIEMLESIKATEFLEVWPQLSLNNTLGRQNSSRLIDLMQANGIQVSGSLKWESEHLYLLTRALTKMTVENKIQHIALINLLASVNRELLPRWLKDTNNPEFDAEIMKFLKKLVIDLHPKELRIPIDQLPS